MRLKKLHLSGFKSFADKTILGFSPGITAIVGPNGCGKSNISDAFRWVLGEQSAKSLRGNKMPDVIFAGTNNRPALNIAEVTLTLCNSDGLLPVQYEEVEISRRLHRSGESEYLLNRQNVRHKDIQDLLLDSGVGKDAFSIFEQGKLDQVIQYSPLERRYVFEESAGILRFLQRKREALRKLEQVDLNISRVRDIHREVEQQIAILEQQAAQALIYREQRQRLDLLEKVLFLRQSDLLEQKLQSNIGKGKQQQQLLELSELNFQQIVVELEQAKEALLQKENIARDASEMLFRIRNDKSIQMRDLQSTQERIKENQNKERKWQQDLAVLDKTGRTQQSESEEIQKRQQQMEQEASLQKQLSQEQRAVTVALEEKVSELRNQYQGAQHDRLRTLQKENSIEGELKQNRLRHEVLQERKEIGQKRSIEMQETLSDLQRNSEEKKLEQKIILRGLDEQKNVQNLHAQHLQKVSQEIEQSQHSLNAFQSKLVELKTRHKVLARMHEEREGFSAGSKKLLHESANAKSPLFGLLRGLYECFRPKNGAEVALAAVLRPYAQTLVVETKEQLHKVITFAQKEKLKDFSLLCLEAIPTAKQAFKNLDEAESLQNQVESDPLVNHFLTRAYTVADLKRALEVASTHPLITTWIASEGALLDERAVLFFAPQGEQNAFVRDAEIKKLEIAIEESNQEKEVHAAKLNELTKRRSALEVEHAALEKGIRRDEISLVEINTTLQRFNNDVSKMFAEEEKCRLEAQAILEQLSKIDATIADLVQQHQEAHAVHLQAQERCTELDTSLQTHSTQLKAEREKLQALENSYKHAFEEQRKLQHQLQLFEMQQRERVHQERRLKDEVEQSHEFQKAMEKRVQDIKDAVHELQKAEENAIMVCQMSAEEVQQARKEIESKQVQQQEEKACLARFQAEITRLDTEKSELSTTLQATTQGFQERFNSTADEIRLLITPEAKMPTSIDQTEKQIRTLRREMEAAGNINMTSIEECDKHKARFEFLSQQINDLEDSKKELMEIITSLDAESRKLFRETFEAIRFNFQKHFKTLFNGGEADLQFTEAEDILEAGIEIVAKPPGKHMCSISLLSGGEKCLTAMALLFALFEVKPAPFCILDEIDAPLDDANVGRFVQVVKEFTDRCQFIIITHHKRTMEIADLLCGVTMQEKGVSKMLTMEMST